HDSRLPPPPPPPREITRRASPAPPRRPNRLDPPPDRSIPAPPGCFARSAFVQILCASKLLRGVEFVRLSPVVARVEAPLHPLPLFPGRGS
uniref:Uncharacterized protein n=1 Tax=Triticum urartu TaxID=4572 RepID=A0A8R7PHU9_TRIUA